MSSQFLETKKIYQEFIHYQGYLDFEQWISIPDDFKAAYLYVEFYNTIYLSWYKTNNGITPEEDAIEAVNMILLKNTKIISNNPNRYKENYIFQICFNRLMNLCSKNSRPKEQKRKELEVSNILILDSEEINLFDNIHSNECIEDYICNLEIKQGIQNTLSFLDSDVQAVAYHLMDGKKIRSFKGLTKERREDILKILESNLYKFKDCYFA